MSLLDEPAWAEVAAAIGVIIRLDGKIQLWRQLATGVDRLSGS
ncbi:hypothetical protein [Halochromatium salexigens]|jgi:hypothetical protein|nr:hypothetical protein [Halochromatium salexigens]